jgi:Tol biopolymer transport system component
VVLFAVVLALTGCSPDGGVGSSDESYIVVTVSAAGVDIPPIFTAEICYGFCSLAGAELVSQDLANYGRATFTFGEDDYGDQHVVSLYAEGNCTEISPDPPVTVVVPPSGQTHTVSFDVTCVPNVGSVRVTSSVTPAGGSYGAATAHLEGNSQRLTLGAGSSVTFPDVPVGSRSVLLSDLPAGCVVTTANPQDVDVVYGDHSGSGMNYVEFDVQCSGASGTLQVTTSTRGSFGSGAFAFGIAGAFVRYMQENDTVDFGPIAVGDQIVSLDTNASNCVVSGQNPRTVRVVAGTVTPVRFDVVCAAPPMILYETDRDGDFEILRFNVHDSGFRQITSNDVDDEDPSWSWDGEKIVFRRGTGGVEEIWVMDAFDGANQQQITSSAVKKGNPAFSPNGSMIVYDVGEDDSLQIWIGNAAPGTGHDPQPLTFPPGISRNASFNANGTRILFESNRDGDFDLYLMDPDGGNVVPLANAPGDDVDASWSPVGSQIVFANQTGASSDLWMINSAGTIRTPFLVNPVSDWQPVFTSDGAAVVFASDRDGTPDIFHVNVDGTGLTRFHLNSSTIDEDPASSKPAP